MTKSIKTTAINSKKKNEEGKKILVSSSDFYYDDCPICQGMKKAKEEGKKLSEEELIKLFEEVNKKNSN